MDGFEPRVFGKAQQQLLVGREKIQDAGEKLRLARRAAQLVGADPGRGQECAELFWVTGNKTQGLNGDMFGGVTGY